jgi:hypothetical protein
MAGELIIKNGLVVSGSTNISGSVTATSFTGSFSGSITSASYAATASIAVTASYATNGGVTQLLAGANITLSPTTGLGQVTISSTGGGGGTGNTATGSYGSFYSTETQTNVASTARSMSLNVTDITNGVSISGSTNPFNTYIKVQNPGVYDIQFSAQVDKTDSGTDEIWIWIRKNGTDISDSATSLQLVGNGAHYVAAWNFFVNAAANDYFQLIWYSTDANVRLHAESGSGVVPRIPSLIVTANRVDQFLSNTGSFSGSFTGQLFGTSSWSLNAVTASYIVTAQTASYVLNAISSSFSVSSSRAVSSSFALSSSYALSSSFSQTASFVTTAQTASFVTTAQTASYVLNAVSSSFALSSSRAVSSSFALSSSRAVSSSFALSSSYALSSSFSSTASLAPLYVLTSTTSSMLTPYLLIANTSSMLSPYLLTSRTSSFATTGSGTFSGSITISGSLGVGTAAPTTVGLIRATNDIIAFYSSDERLKTNKQIISNPLEKLNQINGYEFDWIPKSGIHENEGHDIGVIAQEIEKILPDIVTTRDNGYKAVKYEKIVALLIEAVKDLQNQVNKLKNGNTNI